MPNVLVRDLPASVHAELARRARARGQSLQQYLAGELERLAARPSLESVLERVAAHSDGRIGLEQAALDLADHRGR